MPFSPRFGHFNLADLRTQGAAIAPGVASTLIIALAATYLSDHYHAPPVIFTTFIAAALTELSKWLLVMSVAALGMKTSLRDMVAVGSTAIALIAAETIFLALLILAWIWLCSPHPGGGL
jgi:uncharacterized membrane protein YadS